MGIVEYLFETKKGKTVMGLLYGLGAAVVIVGALFKIMHWPGAGPMLVVGLSTEALIFAVSAFEPQHLPLDWTLAYPELAGMDDEDGHGKRGNAVEQLDTMLEEAKIGPELIESLGQGLRSLSTNANKLSEISDASVATAEYTSSLQNASSKVTTLAGSYEEASQALTGLTSAAESGAATGDNLKRMASTLEALNASYESQLNGSQQQAETMKAMYAGITALMTNLSDSVEDTKRYKENIAELSTNLSALNNVYGNMLTAMKS
ncbi:MAG: gliding motility protein GldL [Flavobacteriales bacterium CG18_big_fil_WC_8_21_14_2_50_32_9]|nr:gliding motility protein GldL [Flavobacteriales bacterium]PIQ16622.1 MAG: gliding motility protein GldL [Flavobacteriales bacterium CG18_big_fil_WC_8_21_14_2_50_32_9]